VPEEDLDDIGRIFDGRLTYDKGGTIVHMLRHELQDDDIFFQILHDFQVEFTDSMATGLEFKAVAEDISGMDFTDFFDQWYFGEGYPIYDITWNQNASNTLTMHSVQSTSTTVTPLFKMLMPFYIKFMDNTDTTILLHQTDNVNDFSVDLDKEIGYIIVDREHWILFELGSIQVGIEDRAVPVEFSMWPNPAQDNLQLHVLDTPASAYNVSIADPAGRMIFNQNDIPERMTIDLRNFAKGLYFLTIENGENKSTRKFLKK